MERCNDDIHEAVHIVLNGMGWASLRLLSALVPRLTIASASEAREQTTRELSLEWLRQRAIRHPVDKGGWATRRLIGVSRGDDAHETARAVWDELCVPDAHQVSAYVCFLYVLRAAAEGAVVATTPQWNSMVKGIIDTHVAPRRGEYASRFPFGERIPHPWPSFSPDTIGIGFANPSAMTFGLVLEAGRTSYRDQLELDRLRKCLPLEIFRGVAWPNGTSGGLTSELRVPTALPPRCVFTLPANPSELSRFESETIEAIRSNASERHLILAALAAIREYRIRSGAHAKTWTTHGLFLAPTL